MLNKNTIIRSAGMFILMTALLLTSCSSGPAISKSDLMADVQAQAWPREPEEIDPQVAQGLNQFAVELLQQSAGNTGNIMISPASVFLALAMTLQGAEGETADVVREVISGRDISLDNLNRTSRALITELSQAKEGTLLSIANSIWFDSFFEAEPEFLQSNADYFRASARKLDFADSKTITAINDWVSEATQKKITSIVDQIDPSAVMFLINAVYFKADWAEQFDKADTREGSFKTPDNTITTDFMYRTGNIKDISDDGVTGIALPYKDSDYVFFALMPVDQEMSARQWLNSQSVDLFSKLKVKISDSPEISINLGMPKFEAEYEDSLKDDLISIGMEIAFDPAQADFSKMQVSAEKNLYIGEVKHKTYVRVDEKGTEAAAATSVEMRATGAPMSDKDIILDRPFMYGIMHLPTGTPLFAGIMEDPSKS